MGEREEAGPGDASAGAPRGFDETRTDLEQWRGGDRAAGDRILQRYRPALDILVRRRIAGIANGTVRSRLSADDVLHDALLTVSRKLPDFSFRGPGSLFGWMLAIAENQVRDRVDYWEMGKRTPSREQGLPPAGDTRVTSIELADASAGPRTRAENAERDSRVAEALAQLPEREFQIVMLRYYFGAEWDDIARAVGAPSGDAVRKEHAKSLPALAPKLKGL